MWCARVAWAALPVTAGGALADAIDGWPVGAARLATVLLWATWSVGLLALLAPRPWGCTLLRIVAPLVVVAAIASITSTSGAAAVLAVASTFVAAALALSAPVVAAAGNALAYGDEQRFPMRIPTPLLFGPVPLAIAAIGVSATAGPLLLAGGAIVVGIILTIVGLPLAFLLVRSLHTLSRRWLVVVPAGVTFVDPMTLGEPVLVRRAELAQIVRAPGTSLSTDVLDLRLGTIAGGIEVDMAAPVPFARRRGRAGAQLVEPPAVVVALARPGSFLAVAAARRLRSR